MISALVAMSKNGVIGKNGRLPWSLPDELDHFTKISWGHHIIMGRKTHESIGRPLEGRENLIISRDENYFSHGCKVFSSIESAINFAKSKSEKEVMIIGGAKIYSDSLKFINKMYISVIDVYLEGDAYFPCFDWRDWEQKKNEEHKKNSKNIYDWDFIILEKKK